MTMTNFCDACREETAWERRVRKLKETAFLGALIEGAETAADVAAETSNRFGDRVFGETETSLCMGEIKRDDPKFDLNRFLKKLQHETIPFVLQNYLENKLEPLEVYSSFNKKNRTSLPLSETAG